MKYATLKFVQGSLEILDQRGLPERVEYYRVHDHHGVAQAIRDMVVRGAPAIGAAAAYGVCLAAQEFAHLPRDQFDKELAAACSIIKAARPTAVNLAWAVARMERVARAGASPRQVAAALRAEADRIAREDVETNRAIGRHGSQLVPPGANILTHCNTGSLATVGYGTALGVIRAAHEQGKVTRVYANETRPRLQGANLTAFELVEEGIPATLIVDSVAATLFRDGKVDLVVVGADRIAANGDVANKIGTFMLSELAARFGVPFYVAAPLSTVDLATATGADIVIEERAADEVTHIRGVPIAPEGIAVYNPAFDVTPHGNVTAIITEVGVLRPPYSQTLAGAKGLQARREQW